MKIRERFIQVCDTCEQWITFDIIDEADGTSYVKVTHMTRGGVEVNGFGDISDFTKALHDVVLMTSCLEFEKFYVG